jgi:diguanylate cyclase (GGDEF)-like protein
MQAALSNASRLILLTALYFGGAAIAVLFLRTPSDVTLFWPAAGIAYAMVLQYGLRHAVGIAIAQALLHLLLVPAPLAFLPFSICSNALATVLACLYVNARKRPLQLRTEDGLVLLQGAVLLCLISAGIGSAGMVVAGMVPPTDVLRAYLQWALGDLLGIAAITPSAMLLLNYKLLRKSYPHTASLHWRAQLSLAIALVVSLLAIVPIMRHGTMYPLSGVVMPVVVLLWTAIRYPPLYTALASSLVSIVLALVMGLGLDGLQRPESLADTGMLMTTLVLISSIPILLSASYHERWVALAALHLRATRDPLTGLLNREAFEDQARTWLASDTAALSLIYLDLDNFKLINDAASHAAGNELLRHIAGLLRKEFGDEALVAHAGGDEFSVLARQPATAVTVPARRLLAAIEDMRVAWQGGNLRTTASIGIVGSTPPHASFDELLSQVDSACHEAKELGGNRQLVAGLNEERLDTRNRLMKSALDVREALDQRRFALCCQSVVDLRAQSDTRAHFEILLRWHDGDGQLRPPANLIAAAERFRLGPRLDRYVLSAMLEWFEAHPQVLPLIRQCNLNLGAATLADDEFGDFFATRLQRSSLMPEQLCLEITETSVVRDLGRTRHFIQRMREMGCKFALDDFGTGFCSFSYLRDLQVDYLKIDGSFVRDVDQSPLSEAVVRSITEIAHLLGMRAVAEQVENQAQLATLRGLRVDFAQGYLFQKPIPIDEFFARPGGPANNGADAPA